MSGATCKSCGAPILWIRTRRGKLAPVDAQPLQRYLIAEDEDNDPDPSREAPYGELVRVYTSHFETCPNAAQHRKSGTRRGGDG